MTSNQNPEPRLSSIARRAKEENHQQATNHKSKTETLIPHLTFTNRNSEFGILNSSPTVSFKTIGCRLNQAESDQISAQFTKAGYQIVEAGSECNVAVINTCTITHGAERESARWARRLRRQGAKTVILAGCAIEHNGKKLQEQTGADIIANQTDKFRLLELISISNSQNSANIQVPEPRTQNPEPSPPSLLTKTRALVKAQDGCNFRCSYCIVPDTRGLPYSRPLSEVIDDIKNIADQGVREVVITGANIGCYNDNGNSLINLLEKAEEIEGIERIRISSIESTTAERAVIDFMASSFKLCNFLHLPLQSGDDHTLKQMRRHYTADKYRETVEYAISRIPNLGLGTDIIVGFPGETDQSFQNTMQLVKDLPFTNLHVFIYSIRSGTPAATMPNQVDSAVKKARSAELISLGKSKREDFAKSFIGKNVNALIEKIELSGKACGWTEEYLPVKVSSPQAIQNEIISFSPTATENDTLIADL